MPQHTPGILRQRLANLLKRRNTPAIPQSGWMEVERQGLMWRLNMSHWLDRELYQQGVFEPQTTAWMRRMVKPGMHVVDVGANFGYFTTLLADLVGPEGHVWAFEPTQHYGDRIRWHLEANKLTDRVTLLDYGLSDQRQELNISIGESSATLHPLLEEHTQQAETIRLERFDAVYDTLGIDHVDLLKVDIDGHEPAFLRGAREFLRAHHPLMLIEFFQGNLDIAGSDVRELKLQLEAMGYELHSEKTGQPFPSRWAFLEECGNFLYSVNVWACPPNTRLPVAA